MSTLIESLAQDRHAARYQPASQRRRQLAGARGPGARESASRRRSAARDSAVRRSASRTRTRAGWLLIGLGLRLAMRGGDTPARRARLLGQ